MYCKECKIYVQTHATHCYRCGSLVKQRKFHVRKVPGILLLLSLLLSSAILITVLNADQELVSRDGSYTTSVKEQAERLSHLPPIESEINMSKVELILTQAQPTIYTIITKAGQGSGFLYDMQGHIVTNAHVVEGTKSVEVITKNGLKYRGIVLGRAQTTDIAVIKVKQFEGKQPYPIMSEGKIANGEHVIAVGSPEGKRNHVTLGYVVGSIKEIVSETYRYKNTYEVSANLLPGNSGGPLISVEDEKIIGINSMGINEEINKTTDMTQGLSLPIEEVKPMIDLFINQ